MCHGTVSGKSVESVLSGDKNWLKGDFIEMIQKRGAAIINARKASSALSAARAITNHVHDWIRGTFLYLRKEVRLFRKNPKLQTSRKFATCSKKKYEKIFALKVPPRASTCQWLCTLTVRTGTASRRI